MAWLGLTMLFLMATAATCDNEDEMVVFRRPDPNDAAVMARWLVSRSVWGVLSTVSIHLKGVPFGNVVSFSDGPPGNSSGKPYFYLSKLDPTPQDFSQNPFCSLSISEVPLGSCGLADAESPTCAKITLSGKINEVTAEKDVKLATEALFSKHPQMRNWPKDHNFRVYELVISDIFLVDWFGGAKPVTVADYFNARVTLSL